MPLEKKGCSATHTKEMKKMARCTKERARIGRSLVAAKVAMLKVEPDYNFEKYTISIAAITERAAMEMATPIASIKEQRHLEKASRTLEECGVQSGATTNATQTNTVPTGFASRGQDQSATKLKSDKITDRVSVAHPGLAEGELVHKQVVQSEANVVTKLDDIGEKINNNTCPMPDQTAQERRAQALDDYPAAALKRTELRAPVGPTTKKQLEKATRDYGMEMTPTKFRNVKQCTKRSALQGDAPADVCMTPVLDVPVESHDDVLVDSDAEAAMRRQDLEEILHLKHLDAVERRADEISAHKARLERRRRPEGHNRLEFDFADLYWESPPPGRLMWCDD